MRSSHDRAIDALVGLVLFALLGFCCFGFFQAGVAYNADRADEFQTSLTDTLFKLIEKDRVECETSLKKIIAVDDRYDARLLDQLNKCTRGEKP